MGLSFEMVLGAMLHFKQMAYAVHECKGWQLAAVWVRHQALGPGVCVGWFECLKLAVPHTSFKHA
jgi:hypothetical protein